MKLMTKEIAKKLVAADKYFVESENGEGRDEIVVKFFNPAGAGTWYITSATPLDSVNGEPDYENYENAPDWHMFGFCDLGIPHCAELGYVLLSELKSIKGMFGLGIERDMYYSNGSLSEVMEKYNKAA